MIELKKIENTFHLKLNEFSFNEEGSISSRNSTWFLLKKSFLEDKMNEYTLKEGDMLRVGRITIKIKKIRFSKNKDKEKDKYKDNISIHTSIKEFPTESNNKTSLEKEENQKYKICRICYLEEETIDNPLIQPCICSGSMKYIHLECLKHWLNTSIFIKIDGNKDSFIYLYKTPECELCKTKFTDYIRHNGRLYEILDFKSDFDSYLVIESLTLDKNGNKYIYVVNLDLPDNKINVGRGHNCNLLLSDISVSRLHCIFNIDKMAKKIILQDNNSKFGTLVLVQTKNIIMSLELKLYIQIGRTYLELLLKEPFHFFSCCGVGEKKNADIYYMQNKENVFITNKLTIKNDNNIEFINKYKIKKEEEKNIKDFNLMTERNLIEGDSEEQKLTNKLKEENEKKEEKDNNCDDIEKLIYENEQNNNNKINSKENNIEEEILNKDNLIDKDKNENEIIENNNIELNNVEN